MLSAGPAAIPQPQEAFWTGTRVLVANQSYFQGSSAHQAILAVETGERGLPELIPKPKR